jgi:hypothetical protein
MPFCNCSFIINLNVILVCFQILDVKILAAQDDVGNHCGNRSSQPELAVPSKSFLLFAALKLLRPERQRLTMLNISCDV